MNPFILLLVLETKHLVADFFLQDERHLGKFRRVGWVVPLADHCAVHGLFTLAIALLVNYHYWWVAIVDFVIHFIMDRIKASPDLLGRYKSLDAVSYTSAKMSLEGYTRMGVPNSPEAIATRGVLRGNKLFWWALGVDQYVHQLTTLYIAWQLTQ